MVLYGYIYTAYRNRAVIPVFYNTVKNYFTGGWKEKGFQFFLFYYFIYWCINIIFGLPFGFTVQAVAAFLLTSAVSLGLSILITAGILSGGSEK